jgi:hypothetical protein
MCKHLQNLWYHRRSGKPELFALWTIILSLWNHLSGFTRGDNKYWSMDITQHRRDCRTFEVKWTERWSILLIKDTRPYRRRVSIFWMLLVPAISGYGFHSDKMSKATIDQDFFSLFYENDDLKNGGRLFYKHYQLYKCWISDCIIK